jgi:flagellar basal-body rod protein FlgG
MQRAVWSAASGMQAQQLQIDTIANNLANVNTAGFKRSRAEFQDLLYQTVTAPGARSSSTTRTPGGIQLGLGARPSAVKKIFSQGDLKGTANPLDLAIEGAGFFKVLRPDGTVSVTQPGQAAQTEVGQLELAGFVNPTGLLSLGGNLFQPTESSGDATDGTPGLDGLGLLAQGYLEISNVSVVTELVDMIAAQRAYELNSRTIQAADDMMQQVNNIIR